MMPSEIVAEHRCGRCPTQSVLNWFGASGVPALALAKTWLGAYSFVLLDDVVFLENGGAEFAWHVSVHSAPKPERACTVVLFDEVGDPLDILVWQATTGRMALWLGKAALAGAENLPLSRFGEPLVVHPDPLAWLQNERRGVVVINPSRAAATLRDAAPLEVTGRDFLSAVAHGKELRAALAVPPPTIHVRVNSQIEGIAA